MSFLVGRPPEILEPLLDMEIIAPEEAHLECDIDIGDPPSKIIWYKDSKEVSVLSNLSVLQLVKAPGLCCHVCMIVAHGRKNIVDHQSMPSHCTFSIMDE